MGRDGRERGVVGKRKDGCSKEGRKEGRFILAGRCQ
jgi:hypothetical protein